MHIPGLTKAIRWINKALESTVLATIASVVTIVTAYLFATTTWQRIVVVAVILIIVLLQVLPTVLDEISANPNLGRILRISRRPIMVLILLVAVIWFATREHNITISGKVIYAMNGLPVPGVQVTLAGPSHNLTSTDQTGVYTFTVSTTGTYYLTLEKQGDERNAISGTDALLLFKESLRTIILNEHQRIAGDVSANGYPSEQDTVLIGQYIVSGHDASLSEAGEWKFTPNEYKIHIQETGTIHQSHLAYLMGDVTGNWGTDTSKSYQPINLSLSQDTEQPNNDAYVFLSIESSGVDELALTNYELTIEYDKSVLDFDAVTTQGTLSERWELAIPMKSTGSNAVSLVAYGSEPLSGMRTTLLKLGFGAIGPITGSLVCITEFSDDNRIYLDRPTCIRLQ